MIDGFYWFTSERSSSKAIGQLVDGKWYLINEVGPVSLEEITRRGWDLDERILHQDVE